MRRAQLIGLAVVAAAAVAGAAYTVTERGVVEPTQSAGAPGALLPGLAARLNEVTTLRLATAEKSWTITRAEGGWSMPEHHDYPVDASKVKRLIVGLANMKTIEPKTRNPELYGRIGVRPVDNAESTSLLVELVAGDPDTPLARLLVGNVKSAATDRKEGEVYVRPPDQARAWLVRAQLDVKKEPLSWLDRDLPKIKPDDIVRIEIRHPGGEVIKISRAGEGARNFEIEDIPEGYKVRSAWRVGSIAGAFELIDFEDIDPIAERDFAEAVRSTFETAAGILIEAAMLEADQEWWLHATAMPSATAADPGAAETGAEAFNARFADWAYRVSSYRGENFNRRFKDLVEQIEKEEKPSDSES